MERFAAQLALAALRGLAGPPECLRLRLDCLRLLLDRLQTPPRSPRILHENLLPTIHDSISSQAIPRPTVSERYNPVAVGMRFDLFQAPIRFKTPHFFLTPRPHAGSWPGHRRYRTADDDDLHMGSKAIGETGC